MCIRDRSVALARVRKGLWLRHRLRLRLRLRLRFWLLRLTARERRVEAIADKAPVRVIQNERHRPRAYKIIWNGFAVQSQRAPRGRLGVEDVYKVEVGLS